MPAEQNGHDIVVIGASAGGIQALMEVCRHLPPDLPAALFVVVHVSAEATTILPLLLERAGPLRAIDAVDGDVIQHGTIYVAPPDHHLLIKRGFIRLSRGPQENGFRPAVDPLFRTAALAYGPRVVGVVLSGGLDDGSYGLMLIKKDGGVAIAQDPDEALVPSMPANAIEMAGVHHVLTVREIAGTIAELSRQPVTEGADEVARRNDPPSDVAEVGMAALKRDTYTGPPSRYTCPDCGGALWEFREDKLSRFGCHVGHSFTEQSLIKEASDRMEDALWTALRALEEHADLRRRLARHSERQPAAARKYQAQAEDAERRASVIRAALVENGAHTQVNAGAELAKDTALPAS